MSKLSIIIITKNESSNIEDCIKSVSFANEIIVVDSGSTDNTIKIAKKLGAKVFIKPWMGYGRQKNYAINLCSGDWILSIDADERISSPLKKEILKVIECSEFNAYSAPRKSYFIARFIKYSGWQSDRVTRLFKKGVGKYSNHQVHERLLTKYKIGFLYGNIIHYSYRNVEDVIQKINRYSTLGAKELLYRGEASSLRKALMHGSWAFFRSYFIKLGLFDGREGFVLAFSKFEHTYYKYIKKIYI